MAKSQKFAGDFKSQLHQFNGNNIYGPVFIGAPNQSDSRNPTYVQTDLKRKFTEQKSEGVDERSKVSLTEGLSWDDCLQSLEFEESSDRERVIERHMEGTCDWLLNSPAYLNWINEHGLLLIRGKPGCGKSTILKFAIEKQVEAAVSTGSLVLSFFFYASGTQLQNGLVGLLRSLLLQMLDQDMSSRSMFQEICRKRWISERKKKRYLTWLQTELQVIFERLVLECSARRKIRIFLDAIDECREEDRDRVISLFHSLKGKTNLRLNKPGVCFTCRPYPDGQITGDFQIRLEDESQDDIKIFIDEKLRLPDETQAATEELRHLLLRKADGLFLWIALVIPQIHDMSSQGLNLRVIQSEILKCPRELESLYEDLIKKIKDDELLEAGNLFQWICFALRPLSLDELRTAMTIHRNGEKGSLKEYEDEDNPNYIPNESKMRKKLIYLSKGLIDVGTSTSADRKAIVAFHHETIKDFMLRKGLRYLDSRFKAYQNFAETAPYQLANTCLSYLSTKEIHLSFSARRVGLPTEFHFLSYAAAYWLSHSVEAEKGGFGEKVTWPSQRTLDIWVNIHKSAKIDSTKSPQEGICLMHIAAEHGLERLARSICGVRHPVTLAATKRHKIRREADIQCCSREETKAERRDQNNVLLTKVGQKCY
ncbi:hypothetical protein BDV23DRAFT_133060 [Aspergillus alliaceus]|uniref:Nephrocystin 3-like N-terminal domain-containing protein n=1 Tax=Petromyces alliaceus TaxID=209559 RepID=A0A5N7BZK5_PETAA|nr:hypothetical protein BDV23DRAFT_133060 [Aspergillus alliaceus]